MTGHSVRTAAAVWTFLIVLAAAPAAPVAGQSERSSTISLTVGASAYDLSGTGTSSQAAARLGLPFGPRWSAEIATTYFQYGSQGADHVRALLPEASVRVTGGPARTRAFAVAGVGLGWFDQEVYNETDLTLHVGLGLDVPIRPTWGLRAETRLRSVDPWTGSMLDFGMGLRATL